MNSRQRFNASDEKVVSWKGELGKWEPILGLQDCGPSQRFGWKLAVSTKKAYPPNCTKHGSERPPFQSWEVSVNGSGRSRHLTSWVEQESQVDKQLLEVSAHALRSNLNQGVKPV
jgi:hypothetical protein